MKTTLDQGTKVLDILKGVEMETTQKALESGLLHDVLTTGSLDEIYIRHTKESFVNGWKIICRTLAPEEIVVTRPHRVDTYHTGAPKMTGKYQVRVWRGSDGFFCKYNGHISEEKEGTLLLEWYDEGDVPQPKDVLEPRANQGTLSYLRGTCEGYNWVKETRERPAQYGGVDKYDVFTLHRSE